ncbi:MAG: hypothetical protein IV107_16480 [Paucibacter sp.]|nr:hypothetical protein [Roseateles sp.]
MLNINEEDLKKDIVRRASDALLDSDGDLSSMVRATVEARINKIFAERAEAQITEAIDAALEAGFEREFRAVNSFGQPVGEPTTLAAQLEKRVQAYWTTKVDRNGAPSSSDYGTTTRADFLMTKICAEDFSAQLKQSALNITGALKDGLRAKLAEQMDSMLNDLFRVKSLQDQGRVAKPY